VHWPAVTAGHVSAADIAYAVIAIAGALALAGLGLFGRPLRERVPSRLSSPGLAVLHILRDLHSGHIGDYIAWWTAGTGLLGVICLLALT
jgi:multicomponent Na+:H+ antiporter subunit D